LTVFVCSNFGILSIDPDQNAFFNQWVLAVSEGAVH